AVLSLSWTNGDLPAVFRWTIVPGVLALLIIPSFLREPPRAAPRPEARPSAAYERLGRKFWIFTAIWVLFSLGNSSDSFIFLRSADIDSQLVRVPLYYAGFNITYAIFATPLGALSDRLGRILLVASSLVAFALVYAGWAWASASWQIFGLFLLYGLYYAATEGVARAYVTDLIPESRRGAALGWFTALTGIATLPANLAAAYLWNAMGQGAPFLYGAAFALCAGVALVCYARAMPAKPEAPAAAV